MSQEPIRTPCIKVCSLDASTGWCYGCGRSGEEIATWTRLTHAQREDVMSRLPERRARLDAAFG
jgi:uncharacterized protein